MSTNESKRDGIEALALAIERGDLKILPDRTLLAELKLLPSFKGLYKAIIDAKNPLRDCDCCVFVHIS